MMCSSSQVKSENDGHVSEQLSHSRFYQPQNARSLGLACLAPHLTVQLRCPFLHCAVPMSMSGTVSGIFSWQFIHIVKQCSRHQNLYDMLMKHAIYIHFTIGTSFSLI